ncbi:MAG: N-acetyltransferase [Saprospiraceae bacterium]|nr:MAG: N-acetyltransferase [Saprospiraceae bacterium]
MKIFVKTERLILREIVENDTEGIYELDSDPEVHKYLGNNPIQNREQSKDIIKYIRKQYEENGIGRWAIIDKITNEFIGWTGLKYEQNVRENFDYYDLGYRIKRQYWGKGIATETALEALKYGFTTLNLPEIYAGAHVDNIASNKVLKKVGLRFIETFEFDGAMHNWYKLEKSEWINGH